MEFYGSIDSVSGSITASVFSGSFVGDGGQIYGIQASGVTGLNLSQISSGSATASIAPSGFTVNTNAKILGNLTVTGSIIAQNYIVSSSVTYMTTSFASGSSAFGDSLNDIHLFTGSVNITGSINLNGQAIGTGKLDETVFNTFTSSQDVLDTDQFHRIATLETSSANLNSFSSSINTTIDTELNTKNVISGSIQVSLTGTTGYSSFSSSISSSIATLSGSVATIDAAQNGRLNALETASSSLNTYTSSNNTRLNAIETATSSLNTFTSSINQTIDAELNTKNVISGSVQVDITATTGYNTFSSSISNSILSSAASISSSIGSLSSSVASTTSGLSSSIGSLSSSVASTTSGLSSSIGSLSSSVSTSIGGLSSSVASTTSGLSSSVSSLSSSVATTTSGLSSSIGSLSSSVATTDAGIKTRLNTLEGVTGSYATTGSNTFKGTQNVSGSILPTIDSVFDLGDATHQFRHLYLSSASLYIDGNKVLGSTAQELQITTTSGQSIKILEDGTDTITLQSVDGDISFLSSGGGDIILDPTTGLISIKGTLQVQDGNKIRSSGGNQIVFGDDVTVTGSIRLTGTIQGVDLLLLSSSISSSFANASSSLGSLSSSVATTDAGQNSRLNSLESNSGSLNSFSSSMNTVIKNKMNVDNVISGSVQVTLSSTTGYSTFSSSVATTTGTISSSLGTVSSSVVNQGTRLDTIETATSSLNSFTSSINTTIDSELDNKNVISGSSQILITGTTGYSTFSSSLATTTSGLSSSIGSLSSSVSTSIGSISASIATTDSNQNTRLNNLEFSSASYNSFTSSINGTIKSKLNNDNVVSGSIQVDITATTNYSTFSSSIATTTSGLSSSIGSLSSSVATTTSGLSSSIGSLSSSVATTTLNLSSSVATTTNNLSSSIATTDANQNDRLSSLEGVSGSYATTGSNRFNGDQYVTGSVTITQNLTVFGSSSIVYTTASQLEVTSNVIYLNAYSPAQRFAGISVYDSGSAGATGSLFWDSLNNGWVYQQSTDSGYHGGMFLSGPRNTGSLGQEVGLTSGRVPRSGGGDHLYDSIISETSGSLISISGSLTITGSILSIGTSLVSGSSQIDVTATTNYTTFSSSISSSVAALSSSIATTTSGLSSSVATTTSGLSSSIGSLSSSVAITTSGLSSSIGSVSSSLSASINSLSASIASTNSTQDSRLNALETSTGSINTFTSSITTTIKNKLNADGVLSSSAQVVSALPSGTVSGSSQVLSGTGIWSGSAQLPSGVVSGSSQIDFGSVSNKPTLVSGSSQISYTGLSNIPANIVSSSTQVIAYLPTGTVSGSSQVLSGTGIWSGSAQLPSGVVSGSSQIVAGLPSGTVSGSSQVLSGTGIWSGSAQLPSGVVSGSSQVLEGTTIHSGTFFNGISVVSGSGQISYAGITNIPSGLVSGSSQISFGSISGVPSGLVSGSSQVLSGTGIWSGSAQLPSGIVSGSSQISFGSISGLPTLVSGSSQISFGSLSGLPTGLVSGSVQITLSSTTGFGSYLNQAVLTTSNPSFSTLTLTGPGNALLISNSSTANTYVKVANTGSTADYAYLQLTSVSGDSYLIKNNSTANNVGSSSMYLWNSNAMIEFVPSGNTSNRTTLGTDGSLTVRGVGVFTGLAVGALSSNSATLDVWTSGAGGPTATGTALSLRNGNNSTTYNANQIIFGYSGTTSYAHIIKSRHNSGAAAGNNIDFFTWNYGTDVSTTYGTKFVMTLQGDGSVGINQQTPSYNLHVVGTAYVSSTFTYGISSGTIAGRGGFTDFLGYNPSYGSYIGGGASNGGTYIYAGGYYFDGSSVRTLLHSGNYTSYAMSGAGYSANQNLNTSNSVSFANLNSAGNVVVNSGNNSASSAGGLTLWDAGGTTTSWIGFKNTSTSGWGTHGSSTASYATYFIMDTPNRGWIFRYATNGGTDFSGTNVASISNQGNANFNGTGYFGGALTAANQMIAGNLQIGYGAYPPGTNYYGLRHTSMGASSNEYIIISANADTYISCASGSSVYLRPNANASAAGVAVTTTSFRPETNNSIDLGGTSYRWKTVYTMDLSLRNEYGDYTIVEGEENLYLYNNKSGKVFTFDLTEVDASTAPPKKIVS